ncbi:hypothetical protein E2C01_056444 [Portunus trituberculatus]|uniref:Uncharacterized protein n=1 Tax=Portunus trituberculatus TaxID=210409 RepID=A0A5B7GQM8_PORTR|nr:hypothetical protein [Portunus trituberculatus]
MQASTTLSTELVANEGARCTFSAPPNNKEKHCATAMTVFISPCTVVTLEEKKQQTKKGKTECKQKDN